jgi:hypothetical protein
MSFDLELGILPGKDSAMPRTLALCGDLHWLTVNRRPYGILSGLPPVIIEMRLPFLTTYCTDLIRYNDLL